MERFRKLSLIKQVLYLILIMLIILLISFVISNTIAERIIEKKVTDSVSKILLQVEEKMDELLFGYGGHLDITSLQSDGSNLYEFE